MYDILIKNNIAKAGLKRFSDKYKVSEKEKNPTAILVRSDSLININLNEELLAIARAGSGVNNIPVEKCSENAVVVFNTPGANSNAVKELVIASIILMARKMDEAINWVKSLDENNEEFKKILEKGKNKFAGKEIKNKKLGVMGLGAIGTLVANNAVDMGMDVYGYDPYISISSSLNLTSEVKLLKDINEIYSISDYITLHVPLNVGTREMINSKAFDLMKNGVKILNFSRAELVNEEDLKKSLESKKVESYITDFPTSNIISTPGVTALPHIGASTEESEENCAVMAVNEVVDYLENGNIKNSVNFCDLSMERSGKIRICIFHKNTPGMLKEITKLLAEYFVNIENMQSKPKGELAYTIIDVNHKMTDSAVAELKAIKNVVRVRII